MICLFGLFLFVRTDLTAQESNKIYEVDFEYKITSDSTTLYTHGIILFPDKVEDLSILKGIPQNLGEYRIESITIDHLKERREGVLSRFYVYISVDKNKGKKYIIVDTNCNQDFSDDQMYEFDFADAGENLKMEGAKDLRFPIALQIPQENGGVREVPLWVRPFLDNNYKASLPEDEYYWSYWITTRSMFQGKVTIDPYEVYVTEWPKHVLIRDGVTEKSYFDFNVGDSIDVSDCIVGDTIILRDKKIKLSKVENGKLYIEDLGFWADSSKVGDILPELYANRLDDGHPIFLNKMMKGKYVFIDFWGSWCGPCIAGFPKVVEAYRKLKEKDDVLFMGIALDRPDDIEKVKELIKEHDLSWPNFWVDRKDVNNLLMPHGKLRIEYLPTYLIIDKKGKIIYRTDGTVDEALDFLMNLLAE